MPEITFPTNGAIAIEQSENSIMQDPTDAMTIEEEELDEELIIEDFTIDGICGVY